MKKGFAVLASLLVFALAIIPQSFCADDPPFSRLDNKPYDPETEPDIDMYISHWEQSMPRHAFGSLVIRDILTPATGDPMKPARKGAVLTEMNYFSHASLEVGASTIPSTLDGEQIVFYFDGGHGEITSGGKSAEVRQGIGVLMPPDVEFTIKNICPENPLTMYLISEPIPGGFQPRNDMLVRDERTLTFGGTSGHWVHMSKRLFSRDDGLTTIIGMTPVWFDPMTMGQPHSHDEGIEEVWFSLEGNPTMMLGKELRDFPTGTAYKIPPNGMTPHSTLNFSDKPVKVFWFMKSGKHAMHPYANLDPKPLDRDVEPDPDMFLGNWRESHPRKEFGNMILRDIMYPLKSGDPLNPARRADILTFVKRFSHATIMSGNVLEPSKVQDGEQYIFYVDGGSGTVTSGGKTEKLYEGVGVLMPPDVEFTMASDTDGPLTMYVIVEPVPVGFKTNTAMVVKDENVIPYASTDGHWAHCHKRFFGRDDGLATLYGMGPVWYDPMTIGQPHSHGGGVEEIWFALKGDINVLLGKQIRKLDPGMAYKIPPNGTTPHSNINITDESIKMFWFMKVAGR